MWPSISLARRSSGSGANPSADGDDEASGKFMAVLRWGGSLARPPAGGGPPALRRALGDQEGEAPLLHDVAVLVDDLPLLDDDSTLTHRALHGGVRAAVNRVAHVHRVQYFPLES